MKAPDLLMKLLQAPDAKAVVKLLDRPHPGIELKPATYQAPLWRFYQGQAPYLLVAHLDTVTRDMSKLNIINDRGLLQVKDKATPLGADDRAGAFAALELHRRAPRHAKPSILFCDLEESGGKGAKAFAKDPRAVEIFKQFNLVLELDRNGTTDFVNYSYTKGVPAELEATLNAMDFWEASGSYSDISEFERLSDVPMLNFSVGFHNEHTGGESLSLRALAYSIDRLNHLLTVIKPPRYKCPFQESRRGYRQWDRYYRLDDMCGDCATFQDCKVQSGRMGFDTACKDFKDAWRMEGADCLRDCRDCRDCVSYDDCRESGLLQNPDDCEGYDEWLEAGADHCAECVHHQWCEHTGREYRPDCEWFRQHDVSETEPPGILNPDNHPFR